MKGEEWFLPIFSICSGQIKTVDFFPSTYILYHVRRQGKQGQRKKLEKSLKNPLTKPQTYGIMNTSNEAQSARRKQQWLRLWCLIVKLLVSARSPSATTWATRCLDTETRETLVRRDFVVEQIWHNIPLFSTAYYAEASHLCVRDAWQASCDGQVGPISCSR